MRILWVEDDFIQLEGLFRPLRRQGVTIRAVPTADEGIHEFRNTGPYDLVVVDLIIPYSLGYRTQADEGDPYLGIEVLRKIREVDQRTPVLVLTVVDDECVRGVIDSLGAEIMHKGMLLPREVCTKIRSMVSGKTGQNS